MKIRMNRLCLLLALTGFLAAPRVTSAAARLRIATVAPPGTSFHKHLEDLGAQWEKAPGGGVSINIYPGTQGGEPQIVRRMRVNQLQGAMLTGIGLSQIDESATALQLLPMTFRNWEEVDYVRERLAPQLEEVFEKAGYVVLLWGDAGWVRFFSTKPVQSVQDLKSMRVYASSGSPRALALLREYYTPVELEPDKILLSLRNGMIDAVPVPPFLANFAQVATKADFMLDMKWAPVVGAMVLTKRAWDGLSPATQQYILQTSRAAGEKIRADSRREDDEAIEAMKAKQNLKVNELSAADQAEWQATVEEVGPKLRGDIVPAPMYDAVQQALREFRSKQPGPTKP